MPKSNGKSSSARRKEVRRTLQKPRPSWRKWWSDYHLTWPALWVLAMTVVGGMLSVGAVDRPRYEVEQVVLQPIVSRVEFEAVDQDKTKAERELAYQSKPSVYNINAEYFKKVEDRLDALVTLAADENIESVEQIPVEQRESLNLSEAGFRELRQFIFEGEPDSDWTRQVDQFMEAFRNVAILRPSRYAAETDEKRAKAYVIVIRDPRIDTAGTMKAASALLSADDRPKVEQRVRSLAAMFPQPLVPTVVAVTMQDMEWTYQLDQEETTRRREQAKKNAPQVTVTYEPNQVIVRAGQALTALDLDVLDAEQQAFEQQVRHKHAWLVRGKVVGQFLLVGFIALCLWGYIAAYQPRICENQMRGLALTGLLLAGQVLAVLILGFGNRFAVVAAIFPTLLVTLVLTIVYGQRFALAAGTMLTLLIAVTLRLPVVSTLVPLAGVVVSVGQLPRVSTRSKLVLLGLATGAVLFAAAFTAGLITRPIYLDQTVVQNRLTYADYMVNACLIEGALAFGAAAIVGLLAQGLLPAIEKGFQVTTAMTLRDLNDVSHPLLRRLAQDAPGTYQHSLRLADVAEAAASAIGADGLLCRVGAMYHDIGKMNKPQYFVENQGGGPNRHNKLSPAMSVLIIVGHVKDGIEMAREYRLPQPIRHFIESHHGTTLVEYFFHEARKRSSDEDRPEPTEFEFRYPGPKPRTKEAAILMLGDACESAARTLGEPTPARLEALVESISHKRLMDGQFDESNLTLAELHRIELAIHKMLCAIYHGRVAYPSDKEKKDDAREPRPAGAPVGKVVAS